MSATPLPTTSGSPFLLAISRYESPERMLHLAHLARLAAERCPVEAAGSAERLADLLSRSWREYGNALRIGGRLREAGKALSVAHQLADQGTGDPALRASVFEQIACLHIFQRRFDEADELAQEAGHLYREMGQHSSLAGTMVQRAVASIYAGNAKSAVRLLIQAIPWIDGGGDPYLLLAACHNLVRCYITLGQPKEALAIYTELDHLHHRDLRDPLIQLRAGWLQGQLLRDLGQLQAAEVELLQARLGFSERGLLYETALVALDLAVVHVRLGVGKELEKSVAEAIPIFRSLGVDREVLVALVQLRHLADEETRALELIALLDYRLAGLAYRRHMI